MDDRCRSRFKQVHVIVLGAFLFVVSAVATSQTSLLSQQRPVETLCRAPLYWYVDEVDPRFGFNRSDVITATLRATQMWNQAADVELFKVAERTADGHAIKVRLVYDHRQQLQEYIAAIDAQIAHLGEQVEELAAQLSNDRARLEAARETIEEMNQGIAQNAAQVDELMRQHANRRGQVPPRVAEQINTLQTEAQHMVDHHNAEVSRYNQLQSRFNASVNAHNRFAEQQSELISKRNQTVHNREAEWRQRGLGTESGRHHIQIRTTDRGVTVPKESVTIYSASSHLGLATILAHEFGHVIGIYHVPGATSIMSARLETQAPGVYPQSLSAQDMAALRAVCRENNPPL